MAPDIDPPSLTYLHTNLFCTFTLVLLTLGLPAKAAVSHVNRF